MTNPTTITQTDHLCHNCGRPMHEVCTAWHPMLPMQCTISCAACGTVKPTWLASEVLALWSAWTRFFFH